MKIAILGHKRIPGREGGIEVVVEELSTRMVKLDNDVTVYNRKSKNYKKYKEYNGVKIKNVFTIEKKSLDATVYSFLASFRVAFGRYDIIHYHAIGPSAFLLIPKLFRKKIVVTVHGLNYKTPKWKGFGAKFMKFGEKVVAKYADEIIVLSQEQKKYFKEKYNRDTKYISNGVSIRKRESAKIIKEKFGLEKNRYNLLVSRIVPGKGIETLLEAYKKVKTDMPLIICGDSNFVGEFKERLMQLSQNDKRIKFIGFQSGKILDELYSNANLFIFPSEAEGMPMVLLEALSYNTPCLVSDIPENMEVGKNYVQYFKTGDKKDLEKQLVKCLNDKNILFKNDTRKYIEEEYDWDDITSQTLKLYKQTNKKIKKGEV